MFTLLTIVHVLRWGIVAPIAYLAILQSTSMLSRRYNAVRIDDDACHDEAT